MRHGQKINEYSKAFLKQWHFCSFPRESAEERNINNTTFLNGFCYALPKRAENYTISN
ncbi:MAG: hypothetical protein LBR79_05075 [Oscillospiraceae bacterium]|nr:hypothetical protein [Oscillospiraceae bacterium]